VKFENTRVSWAGYRGIEAVLDDMVQMKAHDIPRGHCFDDFRKLRAFQDAWVSVDCVDEV